MPEPTTAVTSGTVIAAAAATVLELTGIDLPPLVWSLIGASLMLGYSTTQVGRGRAIAQVLLSGFMGALMGTAVAHIGSVHTRTLMLLICAVCGAGAHPITQALVARFIKKVEAHD